VIDVATLWFDKDGQLLAVQLVGDIPSAEAFQIAERTTQRAVEYD
jgi:hypothetical protein